MGAGAGMLAVLLFLASGFVAPQAPRIDAGTATIARYVEDNAARLLTGQVLGVLAIGVFIMFLGHMRHVLARAEGGVESLSPIVTASGIALAAIGAIACTPMAVMALMARQPEGLHNAAMVRMLFDTYTVAGGIASISAAVFLFAAGAAMVHKELLSRWLGFGSLVMAGFLAIGGAAMMTNSSYDRAAAYVVNVGYLGFAVVVFVASAVMFWHPEVDFGERPEPLFVRAH
jgi:hypothetical protein